MAEIPWGNNSDLDDSQFYNREDELYFLHNILNTTKDGIPPAILLTGVRGVGKTALMKKLRNDFCNDYLVVYVDLSMSDNYQSGNLTREGYMEHYYDEIIRACKDAGLKTIDKKLKKFIKTNDLSIGDIVDFEGVPLPIVSAKENYKKLADFVMNLPQMIYEEYCNDIKGVLVFFDEFQVIKDLDKDLNSFLWYVRGFVQSQKNTAYMFTGSMSLKDSLIGEIAGKNGAFGGRILTYELEAFSYDTTRNYLIEKAGHLRFSESGFERFYKCTGGIPFYINSFARLLSHEEILDEKKLSSEFKNALPFLAIHLISYWDKLTFQEQKVITALVDGPQRRVRIAEKLNVTSGAIGGSLNSLQDKALIEMDDGKYKISDSIFRSWLKSEFERKGVYPYRSF